MHPNAQRNASLMPFPRNGFNGLMTVSFSAQTSLALSQSCLTCETQQCTAVLSIAHRCPQLPHCDCYLHPHKPSSFSVSRLSGEFHLVVLLHFEKKEGHGKGHGKGHGRTSLLRQISRKDCLKANPALSSKTFIATLENCCSLWSVTSWCHSWTHSFKFVSQFFLKLSCSLLWAQLPSLPLFL